MQNIIYCRIGNVALQESQLYFSDFVTVKQKFINIYFIQAECGAIKTKRTEIRTKRTEIKTAGNEQVLYLPQVLLLEDCSPPIHRVAHRS